MKRLLFALFVLGVSSSASAQSDACSIMFAGKYLKPAAAALDQVAMTCNYESPIYPSTKDVPNQLVNLDGKSFESITDANSYILAGVPFAATVDTIKKTITVKRKDSESVTGSSTLVPSAPPAQTVQVQPARPTMPTAQVDSRRTIVEQILSHYPKAYEPDGTIGSFNQLLGAQQQLAALNQPTQIVDIPYTYANAGYSGAGYNNGSFFGNSYGYGLDHVYVQHQIDQNNWGALKFKKGREALMQDIEVYGCKKLLTQADEANNFWDRAVLVPVDCNSLTFRYSSGNDDWEVEMDVLVVPLRLQSAKNITLDNKFFERARKMTVHRKYTMIEQPDGSLLRVPREEDTTGKPPAKR